ncbi:MAG TPA: UvrD-helicase domain-containing protein [Dissulfurispiraceae bacterium]|nr:UvrD-helicase domain-containing protein [Dissulfurispiraceae bacterium]
MSGTIYYERPDILEAIPKDRHTVIEASAGTGKTYTIEHLFVELLLTQKVNIDNILVLTYTERAAGELRSRVRSMIEKVLVSGGCPGKPERQCWAIGPQEKVHLERALFSFDMAPIHTIHSFFQRVVNEHAFSSGRLFEQSLVDGESAFHDAFMNVLRTDISCRDEYACYLDAWLKNGHSIDELTEVLYSCHARKRIVLPRFDETALKDALKTLAGVVQADGFGERLKAALKAQKIPPSTSGALVKRSVAFGSALQGIDADFRLTDVIEGIDPEWIQYVEEKLLPGAPWGREIRGYLDALASLKRHFIPLKGMVVKLFLPLVQERLEKDKRAAGLYDYDDMIAHLLEALSGRQAGALIAALRSRYRFALIDESQDTDERQWKIFERIFLESGSQNILYLVGDPKQAIYGFRGADVFTYLAAREAICMHHAPVPLVNNYRSTARLVGAYNELFRQDIEEPFFRGDITYDEPLACGKPEFRAVDGRGADSAPVVIWEIDNDRKSVSAEYYLNDLGRAVAAEIAVLLKGGIGLCDKSGGERRALKPGDIFILTRKESEGRRAAEFLREAGLPFAFYKLDGLFQTPQAEHIRDLLLAVENPFDESRRLRAWMTPFFGVPLDRLSECRSLPETEPLVKRLLDWHALARRRVFAELFSRLINESGLVRRVIFFEDSGRGLTDYLHILEMLLEEASGGGKELADLTQMLADFIRGARTPAREDGTVQRLETDKEAVQIMTMHKSKGLEAAVVFVYGGYSAGPVDDFHLYHDAEGKAVLHLGGWEEQKQRAQKESRDEDRRLLYVAATRAKARLYLPFVSPEKFTAKAGMYKLMNDRLAAIAADEASVKRGGFVFVSPPFGAASVAGSVQNVHEIMKQWSPPPQLLDLPDETERFDSVRGRHAGFEVTSYSRMKKTQGGYSAPAGDEESIFDDRVAEGGKAGVQDTLPGGPRFGKALHCVMESIRFDSLPARAGFSQWAETETIRTLALQASGREGVEQAHAEYLLSLAYNALMSRIVLADGTELPRLAAVQRSARELEFLYPYPEKHFPRLTSAQWADIRIERGFVKGFIDMVFEHGGKLHLLDWKTDVLPDYSAAALREHYDTNYSLQAGLYLIALCKMLRVHTESEYNERIGSVVYCFVRGMNPADTQGSGQVVTRSSWQEMLAFEEKLIAGLVFEEVDS